MIRSPRVLAMLLGTALSGCSAGPQHPRVDLPLPPPVAAATLPATAGPTQRIMPGRPAPADWWTRFGSPRLDALVARALAANTDLAAAEATLRQAREQRGVVRGAAGPQVDAGYQVERARVSNALSSPLADVTDTLYTLHTSQLSVTYPLDLFGGQRSRIRSAAAATAVAAARLDAARTSVVANLALAVIEQAALQAQVTAAEDAIRSNRDILDLLRRRQALGDIGAADVAAQASALATTEAVLPPLQRQAQHQRALIATLTGTAPGATTLDLPSLAELHLPTDLPVALPADLVAARPDVRAAAAQMEGAAADLGTAIAARLPSITLSGNAGGSAERFARMFATGNPFYALIGGLTAPIFHAGALRHQQRAAEAALDLAKAQYRGAALQAFVDVDDAVAGLRSDAVALDAATRARDAANQSLGFTRRQLQLGGVGTLALLGASAASAQAASTRIQAEAARLADTVALFQAVGGTIPDPAPSSATETRP